MADEQAPANDAPKSQGDTPLEAYLRQVLGTTMRGAIVSTLGVPPVDILAAAAKVFGSVLSGAVQADLTHLLQTRKILKDRFAEGVASTPMKMPPAGMPQNGGRPRVNG